MRAIRYAFDEAVRSLWRGRQSGALSTATIATALFVLGVFLLVTANLERLGAEWSSTAEMSVYLKDDASADERRAIEAALNDSGVVTGREFVSKAEALTRFKQTFGDLGSAFDTAGENPLPPSYEVRLRTGPSTRSQADLLAGTMRKLPGVVDVRYDQQWLARLLNAVSLIRNVGFGLSGLLTLAAALTVANVIRLALYARRDEVEIMELVGAPRTYIRGPFVMEGVLQGGIGAVVALFVLAVVYYAFRAWYLTPLAAIVNVSAVRFLPVELSLGLILGGMAVGCVGGLVAASGRTTQFT